MRRLFDVVEDGGYSGWMIDKPNNHSSDSKTDLDDQSSTPMPDQTPKSTHDGTHRLPVIAKIGMLLAGLGLASIGYFSQFKLNPDFSKGASPTADSALSTSERKPVGDFQLVEANGQSKAFSEYKGQVVILSFWASWCTPCLVELPTFAKIADQFADRGLKIVPINVDEADVGPKFAQDFWQKSKFEFASYFDPNKVVAAQMGVDVLPSNFVIDREGRIAFSGFGATDWSNPETVEFLESLLDEPGDRGD